MVGGDRPPSKRGGIGGMSGSKGGSGSVKVVGELHFKSKDSGGKMKGVKDNIIKEVVSLLEKDEKILEGGFDNSSQAISVMNKIKTWKHKLKDINGLPGRSLKDGHSSDIAHKISCNSVGNSSYSCADFIVDNVLFEDNFVKNDNSIIINHNSDSNDILHVEDKCLNDMDGEILEVLDGSCGVSLLLEVEGSDGEVAEGNSQWSWPD